MPIDVQLMGMLQCPKVQGEGSGKEGRQGRARLSVDSRREGGTFQLKGMQRKKA